jgi:hypothetical protein
MLTDIAGLRLTDRIQKRDKVILPIKEFMPIGDQPLHRLSPCTLQL